MYLKNQSMQTSPVKRGIVITSAALDAEWAAQTAQLTDDLIPTNLTETMPTKAKKSKDPNAPKRPNSAYMEYVRTQT
jgi:hypothetical protein